MLSLTVSTVNSQLRESTEMLFFLAAVCSTAVRKPVGNVKLESQNTIGGWAVVAHFSNCSTRSTKSRVHDASGFMLGYAYNTWNSMTHAQVCLQYIEQQDSCTSMPTIHGTAGFMIGYAYNTWNIRIDAQI